MKIKKINEDKVQIIITNQDLEERDFKKWEFMPIGPKAQELFQDLLDMAYHECGFQIEEDSQLMVEAYPLSVDSIAVIMTKVHSRGADNNLFTFTHHDEEEDFDEEPCFERGTGQVWGFADLETCIQACHRLDPDLLEKSALYKYLEGYYLAVNTLPLGVEDVAAILGEYADWIPVDEVFFKEHGQTIIQREAVTNLAGLVR
ncbi:MAG TPA: adaptor protein MecA [Peptococcaceae bacterium]|jgi:adapter protein MecA 1/2|nr:adaptor protein MecA [Clostridia bacterium]HOB82230.1 adaptor protein MecA [Peptococcaceae bacterium]HPZ71514.1 adaptor protein MecA [Peptococcaceae bacterium]HQD54131.1 adaptor protein MecA [Peptococcaceae bacterium]